jgi:glyoxylase-like metal-dependent hydrolase (beta-lactamase superfamily II)
VPADQINILYDGDVIDAAGIPVKAIDTPGHAYHHMAYWLDGVCFTGDVAAVRLPGYDHIRLPTPPPEFHLGLWKESVARLRAMKPDIIVPTHYGPKEDADSHFDAVIEKLDVLTDYLRQRVQAGDSAEQMMAELPGWLAEQARSECVAEEGVHRYEVVVPSYMNVTGVLRYFRKVEGLAL